MSCYLVQEIDGVSRFTLEDGSGSLLLESCVGGAEYRPVGDNPEARAAREARRGRRRREDDDEILFILSQL